MQMTAIADAIKSAVHSVNKGMREMDAQMKAAISSVTRSFQSKQTNPLRSLPGFRRWFQSGGPARAGMAANDFAELHGDVAALQGVSQTAHQELMDVHRVWDQLMGVSTPALARVLSGKLVTELNELNSSIHALLEQAAATGVATHKTDTLVTANIGREQAELKAAQDAKASAERAYAQANRDYKAARSELEGGQGFLNGFLTGLTLGIHNPVKANMDKASRSMKAANAAVVRQRAQIAQINQSGAELRAAKNALQLLQGLKGAVTDIQNAANAALNDTTEAHRWLARGENITIEKVLEHFRSKAQQALANLFAWEQPLRESC